MLIIFCHLPIPEVLFAAGGYKTQTHALTSPLMYVCSCSLVMLSKSAPCCWQLILASLHDSVAWKLNW